jgi:hypothetical protein
MFATGALVACFDEKDFALDKISFKDIEPEFHLPVLNDTMRLGTSYQNILYDEHGIAYLSFAIENNEHIIPDIKDFFALPDTAFHIQGTSFPYPGGDAPHIVAQETHTLGFVFASSGQQVDSLQFESGTLTFNNTFSGFNGTYTVTIPALKKGSAPFSATLPFNSAAPQDLSGYSLIFLGEGNTFDISVEIGIAPSGAPAGTHNFATTVEFSKAKINTIAGRFGPTSLAMPVNKEISTFDKFKKDGMTDFTLEAAYLAFHVNNGTAFPFRLSIDSIRCDTLRWDNAGSVTVRENKGNSGYFTDSYQLGGKTLGAALSSMPSQVAFYFSTTINPDGVAPGTLTSANTITISNVEVRIPLKFKTTGLTMTDTLDFDFSKATPKSMELFMTIDNRMPVAVSLQAYLMDENDKAILSDDNIPVPLFQTPVEMDVDAKTSRSIDVADGKYLKQTKKLRAEITVKANDDYVNIKKDNYIYIQIGAKAKVNIDELD